MNTVRIGKQGEDLAAQYLQKQGLELLQRNFRTKGGEIDLIARDGNVLVFIEVKTSRSSHFHPPETWVDERKQSQIIRVAEAYLQKYVDTEQDCRFDIIAVSMAPHSYNVRHIKNAFWVE